MKKIWHPFWLWEDIEMWRKVPREQEDDFLQAAIEFTGNHKLYGSWMLRVVEEWPIACEHNLTDDSLNKQAWIGHAACQMAIQCPEYITRKAWGMLTQEQRDLANLQADWAIHAFYTKDSSARGQLRLEMA